MLRPKNHDTGLNIAILGVMEMQLYMLRLRRWLQKGVGGVGFACEVTVSGLRWFRRVDRDNDHVVS